MLFYTDHRPLVGLENRFTPDVDNACLQCLIDHTSGYNITVRYIRGIKHIIADVLSRQVENNEVLRDDYEYLSSADHMHTEDRITCNVPIITDPLVCSLAKSGSEDPSYQQMIQGVKNETA